MGDDSRERYFIINKMYAGSYLAENDFQNIGHEVVNLFSDDNGDNYIYINPYGTINRKSDDSVEAVLLVKYVEKGVLEVVAKAEGLQQVYYKKNNSKEEINDQNEYINKHQITYGNVLLSEIYENGDNENSNGALNDEDSVLNEEENKLCAEYVKSIRDVIEVAKSLDLLGLLPEGAVKVKLHEVLERYEALKTEYDQMMDKF